MSYKYFKYTRAKNHYKQAKKPNCILLVVVLIFINHQHPQRTARHVPRRTHNLLFQQICVRQNRNIVWRQLYNFENIDRSRRVIIIVGFVFVVKLEFRLEIYLIRFVCVRLLFNFLLKLGIVTRVNINIGTRQVLYIKILYFIFLHIKRFDMPLYNKSENITI